MATSITANTLCHCEPDALFERIQAETATLVYLDPPIGSLNPENLLDDAALETYLMRLGYLLQQAHRCLSDEGTLILVSQPELDAHFRLLTDQVFERKNFLGSIVIPHWTAHTKRGYSSHETLFRYSKTARVIYNPPHTEVHEDRNRKALHDDRGPYYLADVTTTALRGVTTLPFEGVQLPAGRTWRYSREKLQALLEDGRLVVDRKRQSVRLKVYRSEASVIEVGSVWDDLGLPRSRMSIPYRSQRPEKFAIRLVEMTTHLDDVVVDPYCGSGTILLAANKTQRRWIGSDSSEVALKITTQRLSEEQGFTQGRSYQVLTSEDIGRFGRVPFRYAQLNTGLVRPPLVRFELHEKVSLEETRHYEFKEVKGSNPIGSIGDVADQYAVAYLNSEGGRIYWGIRDDREVVGVQLSHAQRDGLRRVIVDRLMGIQPEIAPSQFRIELHPVTKTGLALEDLYVVELIVPRAPSDQLYFTARNEAYLKTDAGKRKLSGPEMVQEVKRRAGIQAT
jgi:hypothetical protein